MARLNFDAKAFSEKDCFDHLLNLISSDRFLKKQGLGNEVPFFICPFPAKKATEMKKIRIQLRNKLEQQGTCSNPARLIHISHAWPSITERAAPSPFIAPVPQRGG